MNNISGGTELIAKKNDKNIHCDANHNGVTKHLRGVYWCTIFFHKEDWVDRNHPPQMEKEYKIKEDKTPETKKDIQQSKDFYNNHLPSPVLEEEKKTVDMGSNGRCLTCDKRLCSCEERQSDRSWKATQEPMEGSEKMEDEFISFWDSKAISLNLGRYSSDITQFWLSKIKQAEERHNQDCTREEWHKTLKRAEIIDGFVKAERQRIVKEIEKMNAEKLAKNQKDMDGGKYDDNYTYGFYQGINKSKENIINIITNQ